MTPSSRTFYRTLVLVEILSEEPYEPGSLAGVARDIVEGDCSGETHFCASQPISGAHAALLLLAQGSDPEFFKLDEQGNDLEDA